MHKSILVIFLFFGALSSYGKAKYQCKENFTKVSCKEVKGAKRKGFCAKKNISEKRKNRICKTKIKKRKAKRVKKG